jgi:hypothetical protein
MHTGRSRKAECAALPIGKNDVKVADALRFAPNRHTLFKTIDANTPSTVDGMFDELGTATPNDHDPIGHEFVEK